MVDYLLPLEARKAGERLLAEHASEDPFAAAFKATRMPMIITDPKQHDNPIIFCNKAFNDLTGYSSDELIGRNCRLLQGEKTDRQAVVKIREAINAGTSVSVDILNYRKDGREFWNALFVSPVRDDKEEVIYYFASQLDFTRIKDKEAELAEARNLAEEEVSRRTKDLRDALDAKTMLVHEVDHRVKNNLMTMASIVKLQERMTKNETASATLKSVLNRIEALSTVHRKLFTFDNIARFDVADFAEDLVVNLTSQLKRTDINVTLDLSPVYVSADKASPLSLIVNELVGDAVRRGLGDGGGDIKVTVKRLNGHFLIQVADTIDLVEVDEEEQRFSQMLLETCARQVSAEIKREQNGRQTIVSVTLLVGHEKES
ncbi:PAS domain-containing protein [Agrobacterium larrymoorei]|uniref:PAS domain S-box-containing protein n=1 Tax=Agrobacterium larrymoorei TaxID=160699 RepID=A0ABU0UIN3_9HYPH|nr:PAS domain-containing protein [Agrobacterium larrymoorei]MDQ1184713.1 PAS domain S-box-containing protein [Agrobacterium larrymoorei]